MTGKPNYTGLMHWRRRSRVLDSRKTGVFCVVFAATLLFGGSHIWAAQKEANAGPARYRVFSLRHISAEKGKEYLAEAKIGTVSQLPGANMLLVTAQPRELIKASAILGLVDAEEEFVIKRISSASSAQDCPSKEQIAAQVGDVLIGTFSNPPDGKPASKAIIDIHNDAVVAIAPAKQLDKIISAVEQLQKAGREEVLGPAEPAKPTEADQTKELKVEPVAATEPEEEVAVSREVAGRADANESESSELFSRLLDSLAKAEKKAAGEDKEVSGVPIATKGVVEPNQPTEPETAVTVPEANVPSERPKELDVTAILEGLKAEVKAEPEPRPGPTAEERPVEVEQPNEVEVAEPEPRPGPGVEIEPVEVEEPNEVEVAEPVSKVSLYEPEPFANGEEVLDLDLPAKLPMTQFLDFVGEYLQLDYLYNPAVVKGDVTLRLNGKLRGKIKVKQLYKLLESVMQFYGYAMTRKDNLVTIRPMTESELLDPVIVRPEGAKVQAGNVIITREFKLKHIDTGSAYNLLADMKLGVKITPIPESGTLIVAAYAYRMPRIEELLEMVDKPGKQKKFKVRPLKHTMAETLAPKIKTLAEQLGTISVTVAAPPPVPTKPPPRGRTGRGAPPRKPATTRRPPAATPTQPTVYLEADDRTNRILMIGHEEQLAIVEELIKTLDVEQQELRTLRLYQIENVDAEEVKDKLTEFGIISGARTTSRGPGRAGARTTPRTAGKGTKLTTPPASSRTTPEEALVGEPQVVIIETVNSLLVNATPEQHAQITMIIGYVDLTSEETDIPYVIYPLENQDPVELVEVLNKLVMETTTKQEKDSKIITQRQKTEENIIIIADSKTYSLIVYASKRNQRWISSLIKKLDEYRPQVLLDVTLVEITKTDDFTLNLSLFTKHPTLGEGGSAENPEFSGILQGFPGKRILEAVSTAGTGAKGFYADEHIQAIFDTMQKEDYGRILARPKLLVNDNEKGTIKTSEDVPIVSVETKVIPAIPGGGAATAAPSVKIDTYTAGITLDIEPHISKGDQLRLTIALTRTDFRLNKDYSLDTPDGAVTGPTPPDLLTSDVVTVVTVPDNHTIILGGLERINQSKGGTKIPILGDIPILGGLFRNTANTDTQNRLYVFVKAHILRPGEKLDGTSDIEIVSAKNRAAFERYEEEMQNYEDWPGIKPTPMDPLRILETD